MNKLKTSTGISLLLIAAWVLFALIDMWFDIVSVMTFIKISISVLALCILVVLFRFLSVSNE